MSDDLSDLVRQMLDGMHTLSKTDTILGEPIQAKNATLIPVHRLRIGFAAGTAKGDANADARRGQSGGRGVGADKIPRLLAVDGDAESALSKLMEQLPELLIRAAKGLSDRVVAPVLAGDAEKRLAEGDEGDGKR
jgi:uncharacterized spore protein YtfJ